MSRLALAAIVFSCLTTAFCGSAQKVPLFRQRMAERVHVDLTMLDSLVKQDHVLQGRYADELETANRTYEKLSLSNNLEAVVALTNGLEKYHAELEKFRKDCFGFGELYVLSDAAWGRAQRLVLPQDLVEAVRVRKEITTCRLVLITGLSMRVEEREEGNAHRQAAALLVKDIDGRLKPVCREQGVRAESSKSYREAESEERLGRELVEAGYWGEGEKILRHAAELYENAADAAILGGLD